MKIKGIIFEWILLVSMVGVIAYFCVIRLHQLHIKIFIGASYTVILFGMIAFHWTYKKENESIRR